MTPDQKQELRDLKIEVSSFLNSYTIPELIRDIDPRIYNYAKDVISNPNLHNLYELLSIKRFFILLSKYEFRKTEIQKFFVFYENLIFTGQKGYVKYELTPVQCFQFASIYGFYKPDGRRLVRDALLFVPRKFSKTTGVAAIAINDLLFGDNDSQSYVAANSYDQAKICFDIIRGILKAHDRRLRHFKINREKVSNLQRGRNSFARALASDADTLDGLNASVVIVDEYSQADSAGLKNVLTSSMGARLNPLTITITTASEKINGPFADMLKSYKRILTGDIENDSVFVHIFEPDVDDEEYDPNTWKKVQPHMGITVQDDSYAHEYQKALLTSADMLTFRTKLLNIFAQDNAKLWFSQQDIIDMYSDVNIESVISQFTSVVSVDLSVKDDFSAVAYSLYNPQTEKIHTHIDYYFPEGQIEAHPNREIYKKWAEKGFLKLVPGDVVDYKVIVSDVIQKGSKINALKIGYDSYKSQEFVNLLKAHGFGSILLPVSQTYGTFTSPIASFEIGMAYKKFTFNPNPITPFCFGNCVIDEDRMENKKPLKRSQYEKIDGAICTLMNIHLFDTMLRQL